jgi:pectinesterase
MTCEQNAAAAVAGGVVLMQNCELNVIPTDGGSLTAQKRQFAYEGSGYSFVNCAVTGSGPPTVLLGRAWGAYSRVVFAYTYFADIIAPQGWFDWDVTARDR